MRRFQKNFRCNPEALVSLIINPYIKDLQEYVQDLNASSDEELSPESQARQDLFLNDIITKTREHQLQRVNTILESIQRIPSWSGTQIVLRPHYFAKSWRSYSLYSSSPFEPVLSTNVELVGPETDHPEFTWFSDNTLDDVLDLGDPDFFLDPKVQNDYFNLVRELRSPGSTQQQGKVLTLFTARPVADRALYADTKTVPEGIFLANGPSHVMGLAIDLAGPDMIRDIYKIRIYSKYVLLSQDLGNIKYYQTVGAPKVPILSISLY